MNGSGRTKFKAAVIGAGKISEEHLKFLSQSQHADLLAVCDLSPSLGKYAADQFQAAESYTDYSTMLTDLSPDVVHILTPPQTHWRIVTECLSAGSHVIVEKPVAISRREFHELWALSQKCDRKLIEDHNYRFNQPVLEMERLANDGALGNIREVDVRMTLNIRGGGRYANTNLPHPSHQLPAGVLHEFLPHLCYLALRFLPEEKASEELQFDHVAAAWSNHGEDELFAFDDLDATVISGGIHLHIRFDCWSQPDCFSITVRGRRGTTQCDLFQPSVVTAIPRKGPEQLSPIINQHLAGGELKLAARRNFMNKIRQRTPYEGLQVFLDRTYLALQEGTDLPVNYRDMDHTLQLTEALLSEVSHA